jgi:hypothetical protein
MQEVSRETGTPASNAEEILKRHTKSLFHVEPRCRHRAKSRLAKRDLSFL